MYENSLIFIKSSKSLQICVTIHLAQIERRRQPGMNR